MELDGQYDGRLLTPATGWSFIMHFFYKRAKVKQFLRELLTRLDGDKTERVDPGSSF